LKYFSLLLILFSVNIFAMDVPVLSNPIIDKAGMFSENIKSELNNEFKRIQKKNGIQIQVLTIESLDNEVLEEYSIKVANEWKLGDKDLDNGLLILITKKERKIRIEVGSGLEGDITDLESKRIIDKMVSFFKKDQFDDGLLIGVKSILDKTSIESNNENINNVSDESDEGLPIELILLLIFIAILFLLVITGNGDIAILLLDVVLSSRGGSGSSWGGGGGGFSGGGSSGNW
jgi:uncharacterized protein